MSTQPIPIRPPCAGHAAKRSAWTDEDWANVEQLGIAYASLERLYVDLAREHERVRNRRLWWDFGSFVLGALAMAIVIALLASVTR
jgi:type IV secretory pathway component VirB8